MSVYVVTNPDTYAGFYAEGPATFESLSRAEQILSEVPAEDRTMAALEMNRMLNMAADAGRPSDAARSVVRSYRTLGAEAFRVRFTETRERSYYR